MAQKLEAKNEPVTIGGAIIAFLVALGPLLQAFGVDLTADQLAAGQTFVIAGVALVTIIVRRKVTPVAKADPKIAG